MSAAESIVSAATALAGQNRRLRQLALDLIRAPFSPRPAGEAISSYSSPAPGARCSTVRMSRSRPMSNLWPNSKSNRNEV